ncbi:hypothetical protein KEJ26_06350 [Candidatus Bathyarchaeota archaeon]|nr:hypothetical protein [Candidatus Bathyarchaeota archaeon]
MFIWWETGVKIVDQHRIFNFYERNPAMHYALPPVWAFIIAIVYWIHPTPHWENDLLFRFLIKFPIILADIAVGVLIYRFVFMLTNKRRNSELASALWLFHPLVIFASSMWGIQDSIPVLFLLSSTYMLFKDHNAKGGLMYGLSIMTKPYTVFVSPLLLACLLRRNWKKSAIFLASSFLMIVAISIPFLLSDRAEYFINAQIMHAYERVDITHQTSGIYQLLALINSLRIYRIPDLVFRVWIPVTIVLEVASFIFIYLSDMDYGVKLNLAGLLGALYFVTLSSHVHATFMILPIPFLLVDVITQKRSWAYVLVSAIPFAYYLAFPSFFTVSPLSNWEAMLRNFMEIQFGKLTYGIALNIVAPLAFFIGYLVYIIQLFRVIAKSSYLKLSPLRIKFL